MAAHFGENLYWEDLMENASILEITGPQLPGLVNEEEVAKIRDELEKELELAPSDAAARLHLEKDGGGKWFVDLSLNFSRGHIEIDKNSFTLDHAIKELTADLH